MFETMRRCTLHILSPGQIVVGQNPYAQDILPKFSSAFAFNGDCAKFWTHVTGSTIN